MNNPKNFDLEKFELALELDEDMALAEAGKGQRERNKAYRPCPRCGSKKWRILNVNSRGKSESCDRCETSEQ